MNVEMKNLTKRFGAVTAVDAINLTVEDGEFVALLGPSGCGKTTTLLMNTGIYDPTEGDILFDGKRVNHLAPRERDIGMVFQSYALYPHMTAYQNIVFSQVLKKRPKEEMHAKAQRIADMLGIGALLERKPAQLSGGQQQRVALGRALIKEPGLLLFDEPLSNLDARLRIAMRAEIKRLQNELGITSLYVTHDQIEAITMADRIAVMNNGIVEAYATPDDLHNRPRSRFIAEFIGNPPMNFFTAHIASNGGKTTATIDGGYTLTVPPHRVPAAPSDGERTVTMGVRPEDIHITTDGVTSEVELVQPLGRDDLLYCRIGSREVGVLADPAQGVTTGDRLRLSFAMDHAHFFDPASDLSLLSPDGVASREPISV